jgi:hypothetical protein
MKKNQNQFFENLPFDEQIRQMTQALVVSSNFLIDLSNSQPNDPLAIAWKPVEMSGQEYIGLLLPVRKWEVVDGHLRLKAIGRLDDKHE